MLLGLSSLLPPPCWLWPQQGSGGETWQGGSGVLRSYKEDSGFLPAQHAFPLPLYESLPVP